MMQPVGPSPPAFGFRCQTCGEWHTDLPDHEVPAPMSILAIPERQRAERCVVEADFCMIDETEFDVRVLLEIPIIGHDPAFVWTVWASLDKADFVRSVELFEEPRRSQVGPFRGRPDSPLPSYPDCRGLEATVHLRDGFVRPSIESQATAHPLGVEQHRGMSLDRAAETVALLERPWPSRRSFASMESPAGERGKRS